MYPRVYLKHLVAPAGFCNCLLKTGQTTQYNSELDDGYYEKGTAKSYTVLTTGDYSGTTNVTVNAKTDVKSNNCVEDDNTGLMWSRYVSASVGAGSDGKMKWTGAADDIFAYCAAANAASLAGHADWRVPNDIELLNLRNMEEPNAAPDGTAFPSWPLDILWSATTHPPSTASARTVSFNSGNVSSSTKSNSLRVALVRG